MGRLKQWPPALLRRWLLQAASGLGCLAVGSIVFLAVGDSVLLSLSVLLALLTSLRCASFYRLIRVPMRQSKASVSASKMLRCANRGAFPF